MTNLYYTSPTDLVPATKARSVDINTLDAATDAAFDKLPTELNLKQGKVTYAVDTGTAANTYLVSLPHAPASYTDGLVVDFKPILTNTGACTVNVNNLGAVSIKKYDGTDPAAGDIRQNGPTRAVYNITTGFFYLTNSGQTGPSGTLSGTATGVINEIKGANIAAAATVNLVTATGNLVHLTGAGASIATITLASGAERVVVFDGINTLVHSASLLLPGGANITTAVNDRMIVRGDTAGAIVVSYIKADGTPVIADGIGGATATGNVTLSITSSAQVITPAAPGYYATLPDASTSTKGGPKFVLFNAGEYDYGIKDSAGTILGWIRPKCGAAISLAANSAAGTWAVSGIEKTGVTAQLINSTASNTSNSMQAVAIDANRTCFLFGGTTVYGVVYDSSQAAGSQWGSVATVRTGISSGAFLSILSAASQVLVVSNDGTTAMEAVTLTIDATTGITVNTGSKGTATLAGNWAAYGQLKAVGASWVVSYGRAASISAIRAISISGTTPTIGSEAAATTASGSVSTAPTIYAYSSTIVLAIEATALVLYAKPWTVSGSTLSAGTEANTTVTAAAYRSLALGSGRICAFFLNTTTFAAIISVTGTIAAISAATLGTACSSVVSSLEPVAISSTKVCALYHAISTTFYVNNVTDNAGTISNGTEVSQAITGNAGTLAFAGCLASTNTALFWLTATLYLTAVIDASGASPVISQVRRHASLNASVRGPVTSDMYSVKSSFMMVAGGALFSAAPSTSHILAKRVSVTGETAMSMPTHLTGDGSTMTGANGATDAITYRMYTGMTSTTGAVIQKLEAAA